MKAPLESPDDIRQHIWRELSRASHDRHHAWRTPVLATAMDDGVVNARTVVLRGVDAALGTLVFYTDARSGKVAELAHQPSGMLVFWCGRLHWQLRVRVQVKVDTSGPEVEALWQRVRQSASAGDYIAPVAPGTPRAEAMDSPTQADAADAAQASVPPSGPLGEATHFTVLTAQVTEMDWLELGRAGHRRARIQPDAWTWLTP